MDKLVNYIEFRAAKYGMIKGIASTSSMYYQIGTNKVRVSDHIKYGEDSVKECDYYFIIQPNDTYIFLTSPKYVKSGKGYLKIVSYEEAKNFIKSLDEFAMQYTKMTDWYIPEDWNKNTEPKKEGKMTWDEFYNEFLKGRHEQYQLGIVNRIESLVYGNPQKGNLDAKLPIMSSLFEGMTTSQYNALMAKMEA